MKSNTIGTVYLIHLDSPIAHASHYIGWAKSLPRRVAHHRRGTGARFLAEAVRRGIGFDVVRSWENCDRNFERKLKNRKNAKHLCPECSVRKTEGSENA